MREPPSKRVMRHVIEPAYDAIDTATNKVAATVTVGIGPFGATVTPDEKPVYVVTEDSENVSIIATASNTVEATIALSAGGARYIHRCGRFLRPRGPAQG